MDSRKPLKTPQKIRRAGGAGAGGKAARRPARMKARGRTRIPRQTGLYGAGFQFLTNSRHWVTSGRLFSQFDSYSTCNGPG